MTESSPAATPQVTDAIPRVNLDQLFGALSLVAERRRATFEDVRLLLCKTSTRRAPGSREAMWTSTRDALGELQRLGYVTTGPLPRRRSEVERLRESPCSITQTGATVAALFAEKPARTFDSLLITWANEHPYFRALLRRLSAGPLFVPDVTSVRQVGEYDGRSLPEVARLVAEEAGARLARAGVEAQTRAAFDAAVHERFESLKVPDPETLRKHAKQWVDLVEDAVVLPALLAAESLPFDPVTFQHLIRISQQFVCASWTSSHPGFVGRIIHLTSEFEPSPAGEMPLTSVLHHGKTWADGRFESALLCAYSTLADGRLGPYVDAYALRAIVCVELRLQPRVFEACLRDFAQRPAVGHAVAVYTELPMRPPPQGESYIELGGHRVGLVKLVFDANQWEKHGTTLLP